jgi:hypothetical protein
MLTGPEVCCRRPRLLVFTVKVHEPGDPLLYGDTVTHSLSPVAHQSPRFCFTVPTLLFINSS